MSVPPGTEETFGSWPGDTDPGGSTPGDGEPTTPAIVDSGIPYWHDAPEIWNTIVIAGTRLPGRAKVSAELRRKLDKKNAKGIDGLTITDDGEDEAPIEITLDLLTREDWLGYQRIVPLINPKGAGKKQAVSVDFPTLALFEITRVYIEAVSVPTPKKSQIMTSVIKATDWRPPPKAAKKSSSTTSSDSVDSHAGASRAEKALGTTGGDDAIEQDNARLMDEFDMESEP